MTPMSTRRCAVRASFAIPCTVTSPSRAGAFQRLLEQVIDTEMFQRLRGIRQTAVMNLVFHGAEHSRFAHSMGAAHVAGLMVDAAAENSGLRRARGEREDTVLAALLHDVGHGPFSHSLEEIIGPASRTSG